jgi:ribosomal protein S18 acetylase RimI-like enzyme
MAGLTIRQAVPDDAEAVERVRLAGWQTAYRGAIPDSYLDAMVVNAGRRRAHLAGPPDGFIAGVAVAGDAVIGWVSAGPCRDEDRREPGQGEVFACYVHPDWWRHGAGRLLMEHALAALHEAGRDDVTLWVLEANDRARRFYDRFGFVPDGERMLRDFGESVAEVRYWRLAAQGRAAQGRTAQGDTAQGHTAQGHTAQGDTAQGDTAQGDTAQGRAAESRTT